MYKNYNEHNNTSYCCVANKCNKTFTLLLSINKIIHKNQICILHTDCYYRSLVLINLST